MKEIIILLVTILTFTGYNSGNEEESYVNAELLQEEIPIIQETETKAQGDVDLCVGLAKEIFEQTNAEKRLQELSH